MKSIDDIKTLYLKLIELRYRTNWESVEEVEEVFDMLINLNIFDELREEKNNGESK